MVEHTRLAGVRLLALRTPVLIPHIATLSLPGALAERMGKECLGSLLNNPSD